MSDVVAVAAVTGGATVLTSAITATVTWRVSRNSTLVEIRKMVAENQRLRREHGEADRRARHKIYGEFIAAYNGFDNLSLLLEPEEDDLMDATKSIADERDLERRSGERRIRSFRCPMGWRIREGEA